MEGASGEPNWVLGGGVAVGTLIQAETVKGRSFLCPPMPDREHKDLDVYVFSSTATQLRLEHPHEIYCAQNFRRPVRCAYHARDDRPLGFYFELLRGYYFGFPPPTRQDVMQVELGGKRLWTLSPEYIIASRCFSHAPLRPETDDRDVADLRRRFSINDVSLAAIVKRSPMRFLTGKAIRHLSRDPLVEGDMIEMIFPELERRHGRLVRNLPSSTWRSLLLFQRGDLDLRRLSDYVEAETGKGEEDVGLAVALMCQVWRSCESGSLLRLAREMCARRRFPAHLVLQLLFLTQSFVHICRRIGWKFDGVEAALGQEFLKTDYTHVFLAKLDWAVTSLRTVFTGDMEASMRILHELFTFMRKPNWQKWVIR